MAEKVITMIGDLVSSRRIQNRADFDAVLVKRLEGLSRNNPYCLSPYTLTIGDEIQAVFSRADRVFYDAVSILAVLYPQKMRFSFSVGTLSKPINPERAIGMDGPAFYAARDGIEDLKKSGYLFYLSGVDIPNLKLMQHTLNLLSGVMHKWNDTRWQTLERLMEGWTVKEIAAEIAVSDKAVYKTIQAADLEEVVALFGEITKALNQSLGEGK